MVTEEPPGVGNLCTAQFRSPERAWAKLRQRTGTNASRRRLAPLIGVAVLGLVGATCGGDPPTAPAPAPPMAAPSPPVQPAPSPPGPAPLTVAEVFIHPPDFPDAGFQIDDNVNFTIVWGGGNIELRGTAALSVVIGNEVRTLEEPNVGNRDGAGWLHFRYVITAEDRDEDGLSVPRDALKLHEGSTIVDVSTQLPVSIDLGEHALENAGTYKVRALELARVTGVRITEVGTDFIQWVWEPVENATGYEAVPHLRDTHRDDRTTYRVSEPVLRVDGFEPGSLVFISVRAVRTRPGEQVIGLAGPWSDRVTTQTDSRSGPFSRAECREKQAQVEEWGGAIPEEWTGEPFVFYFDRTFLPEAEVEKAAQVIETAQRMSTHIEDQLGYSVVEVGGWIDLPPGVTHTCGSRYHAWRQPGTMVAIVTSETHPRGCPPLPDPCASVGTACGVVRYWENLVHNGRDGTIVHEIFHLLGFTHSRLPGSNGSPHPVQTAPGVGIPMSVRLTSSRHAHPSDLSLTFEDVEALRCVYPE